VTALDALYLGGAIASCVGLAWWDPAGRFNRWRRRARKVDASTHGECVPCERCGGEGAGYEAAPSPVAEPVLNCFGQEVLVELNIEITPSIALGHYLSRASRAAGARA